MLAGVELLFSIKGAIDLKCTVLKLDLVVLLCIEDRVLFGWHMAEYSKMFAYSRATCNLQSLLAGSSNCDDDLKNLYLL